MRLGLWSELLATITILRNGREAVQISCGDAVSDTTLDISTYLMRISPPLACIKIVLAVHDILYLTPKYAIAKNKDHIAGIAMAIFQSCDFSAANKTKAVTIIKMKNCPKYGLIDRRK